MIFYLLLCHILLIPIVNSSNTTVIKPESTNKTVTESLKVNPSNATKETLLTEGGSVLSGVGASILDLPKEKLTSLDNELGKNKVKPVVARKGVVYIEDDNEKQNKTSTSNGIPVQAPKMLDNTPEVKNETVATIHSIESKVNASQLNNIVKGVNKTETPKKPLLLSYDSLANMTVKSSPDTLETNQIQSPNKYIKIYTKSANSHPGVIMPIVITILLVPMFAVLGYMALRRGQEAWKNRHYKRMDFLLDGMYND
ncbi:hypothetical protein HF086_000582 [Spodoptera exigua]|uniref:24 kDa salivary protein n=1 Tax=Spodoptera exigua TaxID=7107 RepID=A0A922SKP2_SPOEX|nr:hypothetical protein HF086_000582 [Spodoptera exigua]